MSRSRLLLFPLLLLVYLTTPTTQASPRWNAWGVPLSRGDLQYLSKIWPDVLKLQEIRKEVVDSRLLEPFVRRTKLYNSNQIIPKFEKHSQLLRLAKRDNGGRDLLRLAKRDNGGRDLLRLAKRDMGGIDLLRLAKREMGGRDLLRLAKRDTGGRDLLRLAKRDMGGRDLLRLAKRGMYHDNLLRLSKKEQSRRDDNQLLRLSRSDKSMQRESRYAEDKLLRLAKRVLNNSEESSTESLEDFPQRALELFYPTQGVH